MMGKVDEDEGEYEEYKPGDVEKNADQWAHLPEGYSPFVVKMTLYCVFFVNLFMNIDMGIMASGTTSIQPEFGLDKTQYGSLGSVVYFGQVVGSICAAGLLAKLNSKCILIWCLALNIFALLSFTFSPYYWLLVCSRTFTGLF